MPPAAAAAIPTTSAAMAVSDGISTGVESACNALWEFVTETETEAIGAFGSVGRVRLDGATGSLGRPCSLMGGSATGIGNVAATGLTDDSVGAEDSVAELAGKIDGVPASAIGAEVATGSPCTTDGVETGAEIVGVENAEAPEIVISAWMAA